jgi:hypothetical protein
LRPIALFALLFLSGFRQAWQPPKTLAEMSETIAWTTGPIQVEALPGACAGKCKGERRVVEAVGTYGGVAPIAYDFHEVTRAITPAELGKESDLSIAVRMLLGEVGPSRLVNNEHGFEEAVAILDTVANRMDPNAYNPDGRAHFRGYPGCGPDGTYATCMNTKQYLGLQGARALQPSTHIRPEILQAAVDRAVLAWWLVDTGAARGVSNGATSFVHRCGGTAYGMATDFCDGNDAVGDIAGAEPTTGPLVLKGPGKFLATVGHYSLVDRAIVDYAVD